MPPTAYTAKPATLWTRTRSSPGCHLKAAADPTATGCKPTIGQRIVWRGRPRPRGPGVEMKILGLGGCEAALRNYSNDTQQSSGPTPPNLPAPTHPAILTSVH